MKSSGCGHEIMAAAGVKHTHLFILYLFALNMREEAPAEGGKRYNLVRKMMIQ